LAQPESGADVGEHICSICGQPLPQDEPGAHRRKYHPGDCHREARRRQIAVREGRDPFARQPLAPKTAAKLATTGAPESGGRAWALYSQLVMEERTEITYDEAVGALGGTPRLAHGSLVQLQRLELLVKRDHGRRRPSFDVRPPVTAEARTWVATCVSGGKSALSSRQR
jgi:hypothetical protein